MSRPPVTPRPVTPVGILTEQLDLLVKRLEAIDGVGSDLQDEARLAHSLAAGLEPYLSRCTTPESPALRLLVERTRAVDWAERGLMQEMLSGHVEGQALKFLVHMTGARRVLEIGMFTGYSALAMAEALPDDGKLIACEIDSDAAALAQRCFDESPSGAKIDVRLGPATDTLRDLAAASQAFDLVFLDADKTGYGEYVRTLLDTDLLAPGGVICADNTLMQGQPYLSDQASTANGEAIAAFNQMLVDDPSIEQVMLPLRDGLTLIRRA